MALRFHVVGFECNDRLIIWSSVRLVTLCSSSLTLPSPKKSVSTKGAPFRGLVCGTYSRSQKVGTSLSSCP